MSSVVAYVWTWSFDAAAPKCRNYHPRQKKQMRPSSQSPRYTQAPNNLTEGPTVHNFGKWQTAEALRCSPSGCQLGTIPLSTSNVQQFY